MGCVRMGIIGRTGGKCMKKLICILFAMALLVSAAFAEEAEEPVVMRHRHTLMLESVLLEEHLWCIEGSDADPALFSSGKCIGCDAAGIVFEEDNLLKAEPCEAENCTHRLYRLPGQKGVYWRADDSTTRIRVEHSVGMCIDCGTVCTLMKETVEKVIAVQAKEVDKTAVCRHEYKKVPQLNDEAEEYIAANYSDDREAFCGYAICQLCLELSLLVADQELLEAEPCEPEECMHRFCTLPDFDYSMWKAAKDPGGHTYHQQCEYSVGVCMDCGLAVPMVEVMDISEHQMAEKQGFHIEGQYIHVICEECLLCGMMTGELVPCISYEDGSCERTGE